MVTFAVLGERGYLGSTVLRRWLELGGALTPPERAEFIVCAIRPDDPAVLRRWSPGHRLVIPSTDAIAEPTDYARGKRAIEAEFGATASILRAGIVDIRHDHPTAYADWYGNPLTPLEWAEAAWAHRDRPGVHPMGREILTRYEVAQLVADVFGGTAPRFARGGQRCRVQPRGAHRPPLRDALVEFKRWLG